MSERGVGGAAAGCLVATVGGCVGFGVWVHGARPGLHGAFEGERDWSLLYADLPVMVCGVPAVALAVWALAVRELRGRGPGWRVGRGVGVVASGAVVGVALAALAWACLAWLEMRVAWVPTGL